MIYEQLFNGPISDKRLSELEEETKRITSYLNERRKEIEMFENEYNRLSSKGLILRK